MRLRINKTRPVWTSSPYSFRNVRLLLGQVPILSGRMAGNERCICSCTYTDSYIHIYIYICTCIYIYTCSCLFVLLCVCLCVYVRIHRIGIRTCVYSFVHTYIHMPRYTFSPVLQTSLQTYKPQVTQLVKVTRLCQQT